MKNNLASNRILCTTYRLACCGLGSLFYYHDVHSFEAAREGLGPAVIGRPDTQPAHVQLVFPTSKKQKQKQTSTLICSSCALADCRLDP